jgi:large subunit ribosomal protein L19
VKIGVFVWAMPWSKSSYPKAVSRGETFLISRVSKWQRHFIHHKQHGDSSTHITAIELLEIDIKKDTNTKSSYKDFDYISQLGASILISSSPAKPAFSPSRYVRSTTPTILIDSYTNNTTVNKKIKTHPPPPTPANIFKEPIKNLHAEQIAVLDPTGARTKLFAKDNPEAARVGDILLVRLKTGDPFAGVCINIRRRGVDTGILLRNQLTRVGVEMWYKIYSPNVEGIEVVQRKVKRARRARLTYMRKPKHDMGSVQNIVLQYQRSRGALRGAAGTAEEKNKGGKKKGKGRK